MEQLYLFIFEFEFEKIHYLSIKQSYHIVFEKTDRGWCMLSAHNLHTFFFNMTSRYNDKFLQAEILMCIQFDS